MFSSVLYSLLLGASISFQEPAEGAPEGPRGKTLTPTQKAELEQTFIAFDADGNGLIDKKELKTLLQTTGLAKANASDEEFKSMIRVIDTDHSGTVDFQEFCQLMRSDAILSQQSLEELFKALDVDGNGFVTEDKITACPLFDSQFVKWAREKADANKDGRFDSNEFKALLKKVEPSDQP